MGGKGTGQAAQRKLGPGFPESGAGGPPSFTENPGPTSLVLQRTQRGGASRAAWTERQE